MQRRLPAGLQAERATRWEVQGSAVQLGARRRENQPGQLSNLRSQVLVRPWAMAACAPRQQLACDEPAHTDRVRAQAEEDNTSLLPHPQSRSEQRVAKAGRLGVGVADQNAGIHVHHMRWDLLERLQALGGLLLRHGQGPAQRRRHQGRRLSRGQVDPGKLRSVAVRGPSSDYRLYRHTSLKGRE